MGRLVNMLKLSVLLPIILGVIIFGITDAPRTTIGMSNDNFKKLEVEKVINFLNSHYSPMIDWNVYEFENYGKK